MRTFRVLLMCSANQKASEIKAATSVIRFMLKPVQYSYRESDINQSLSEGFTPPIMPQNVIDR